jgi:hypothetical protein
MFKKKIKFEYERTGAMVIRDARKILNKGGIGCLKIEQFIDGYQ